MDNNGQDFDLDGYIKKLDAVKSGKELFVVSMNGDALNALVRTLHDAGQLYALAGNESGLNYCKAVARGLSAVIGVATDRTRVQHLNELQRLDIQQVQQRRRKAEMN